MRMEFDAFMEAVQELVSDQDWQRILEGFERRRAQEAEFDNYAKRRRLLEPGFSFT